MKGRRWKTVVTWLWLSWCDVAWAQPAAAEDTTTGRVERCVEEHERARLLRLEARLLESREPLAACRNEACPLAVRADCDAWAREVEALIPSVLFLVETGGRGPLRILVDGRELPADDHHRPLELAPGAHTFRFELPEQAPIMRQLLMAPGDQNHVLRVRFSAPKRPASAPPPAIEPAQSPSPAWVRPVPLSTLVLGGSSITLGGTAAALLASALVDRERAQRLCAPSCGESVVDSIERRLLFADVAAAAALVLAGGAAYTYVTRPKVSAGPRSSRWRVHPAPDGIELRWEGAF